MPNTNDVKERAKIRKREQRRRHKELGYIRFEAVGTAKELRPLVVLYDEIKENRKK